MADEDTSAKSHLPWREEANRLSMLAKQRKAELQKANARLAEMEKQIAELTATNNKVTAEFSAMKEASERLSREASISAALSKAGVAPDKLPRALKLALAESSAASLSPDQLETYAATLVTEFPEFKGGQAGDKSQPKPKPTGRVGDDVPVTKPNSESPMFFMSPKDALNVDFMMKHGKQIAEASANGTLVVN